MNSFLKPFVESMNSLSNHGLTVDVGGVQTHYRVGLLAMLADNLGAHAIGGLKKVCHLLVEFAGHAWQLLNRFKLILLNQISNYVLLRSTKNMYQVFQVHLA